MYRSNRSFKMPPPPPPPPSPLVISDKSLTKIFQACDSCTLLFTQLNGKRTLDLSHVPVNKGTNSRLGWTKYSHLYGIVHLGLDCISLFFRNGAEWGQFRVNFLGYHARNFRSSSRLKLLARLLPELYLTQS